MNTLSLTIREANSETDYERIAELINAAKVEPVTAQNIRGWDRNKPSGQLYRRMVGVNDDGQILAYSMVERDAKDVDRQRFHLWVTVDAVARRQGIGAQMFADARAFANANGARELTSETLDNDADSVRFAEKLGYQKHKHTFASRLNLKGFNEAPFIHSLERALESGIRFSTLAAEGNTPEAQFKLYTLNNKTAQDNPVADNEEPFPTFEIFQHQVFNADWFNANGQILAIDGDKYVGLGAVAMSDDRAYNAYTGVDEAYRGRGIAQSLKLLTIRYSIANGASSLATDNDSQNASMLRINRKFGFQPETGTYWLRNKTFSSGAGRNVRIWLTL